jgi:arabinofuranan 3-O-arabinosyltransferase
VLVRSDLDYGRSGSTRPIVVRQALARSPGLKYAAGFGPTVGGHDDRFDFVDSGLAVAVRSVEVFEVKRTVERVVAFDASSVPTIVGGPESLLTLAGAGQLPSAPTILAGDLPPGVFVGPVAITDSLRRREVAFGLSKDSSSGTMTPDEAFKIDGPAHDYLPAWGESQQTTVRFSGGITDVSASSSWADVQPLQGSRPEHQPFAAIDGDPTTSWRTAPGTPAAGQWLEVTLAQAAIVSQVRLVFDGAADFLPTAVTVSAGIEEVTADVAGSSLTVALPGQHATKRIRVTIRAASVMRLGFGGVGISDLGVNVAGLHPQRSLTVPAAPASTRPATVVLAAAAPTASCVFVDGVTRCAAALGRGSEDGGQIDRTVSLPASGSYRSVLTARPRPGPQLNALLDHEVEAATPLGLLPAVTASSTSVVDPAGRPGAVLDGDPQTAWSPAGGDPNPWLRLNWLTSRTVTGLRLSLAPGVAATAVTAVTVIGGDGLRAGQLDSDGFVTFDQPLHTDQITIVFPEKAPASSFDPYRNGLDLLPVAVGEVRALPDPANQAWDLDRTVALPCGSGPTLDVGGTTVRTALTATRRDLLELREVPAGPCETNGDAPLALPSGKVRLIGSHSQLADPTRWVLAPVDFTPSAVLATAMAIDEWTSVQRRLRVQPHPTDLIVAVRENVNAGWQATVAGRTLTPIVVDGWQQGWLLPAGVAGEITLRFTPDSTYRTGLLAGAGTLAFVLLLAVLPARRRGAHLFAGRARDGGRWEWLFPAIVGAAALMLVGGLAAAIIAILAVFAVFAWRLIPPPVGPMERRRNRRRVRTLLWLLPVVAFGIGGWLSLANQEDRATLGPQAAALVTATALWLSVAWPARHRGQRPPQRWRGRSTP